MGSGFYNLIIDNTGEVLYYNKIANYDFKVISGNRLIAFDLGDKTPMFKIQDTSYSIIDTFQCGNGYKTDFHDIDVLPNGNALLICIDEQIMDMRMYDPGGDSVALVKGYQIQEIDGVTKNVVFQWGTFDHYDMLDNLHGTNFTFERIFPSHVNSVQMDNDGNILISARNMDEITKINRTTGDIIWRLGGKNNDFEFTNDTGRFCAQHDTRRISNGNITIFDNSTYVSDPSRAVEYKLNETAMTATMVWEQYHDTIKNASVMGNIQRLSNGNSLIGWGSVAYNMPNVSEYAPDGTKLFELYLDTVWVARTTYRAYRFKWPDFQALVSNVSSKDYLFTSYPNPFSTSTTILLNVAEEGNVKVVITNFEGKTLEVIHDGPTSSGVQKFEFNGQSLPSGMYLCTATFNNRRYTKKLIKN